MAQTNFTPILTYKSDTATSVPAAGDLTNSANGAELAVNTADKRLFTKDSGGNVVEVGTNPSSLTMPNGTANGVIYANGSKVLTSGSALTFDGTTLNAKSVLLINDSQSYFGDNGVIGGGAADGNTTIRYFGGKYLAFKEGATEQMRLTSTGLGIGTSSPATKLDVVGSARMSGVSGTGYQSLRLFGTGTAYNYMQIDNTGGVINFGLENSSGGSLITGTSPYATVLSSYSNTPIQFGTNNTLRMTLDSAGNLGLGVTPSAWRSTYKASQVGNATAVVGRTDNNNNYFSSNWYVNSSNQDIYINTGFATLYSQGAGTHAFYTAASGTAGNAISFTQAMTLDASGNLGVGTTSPSFRLHAVSSAAVVSRIGSSGGSGAFINFIDSGASPSVAPSVGAIGNNLVFMGDGSASERARIDSSGNLLVGTTSVIGSGKTNVSFNGASAQGMNLQTTYSDIGSGFLGFYNSAGSNIGSVTQTVGSAVLYNTTSDQRLKENIQDAESASSLIDSLQVRQFDWKSDNSHQRYGFIAQELVTVAPEAVHQPKDTDEMMAVDYSKLVPMLVKEIQSLRQRVAQLETN